MYIYIYITVYIYIIMYVCMYIYIRVIIMFIMTNCQGKKEAIPQSRDKSQAPVSWPSAKLPGHQIQQNVHSSRLTEPLGSAWTFLGNLGPKKCILPGAKLPATLWKCNLVKSCTERSNFIDLSVDLQMFSISTTGIPHSSYVGFSLLKSTMNWSSSPHLDVIGKRGVLRACPLSSFDW